MSSLWILAVEALKKLDLVGQLRGYFVVVFAVGLFCGSVYLLLSTNVGGQLGFLIAASALTGFLTLLGLIWTTNLTPLNALHGPPPTWKVQQVVDDLSKAKNVKVRNIEATGLPVDQSAQGEIKASVEAALTAPDGEFQEYAKSTDYLVEAAEKIGGGKSGVLGHKPEYAVMKVQGVKSVEPLPGQAPPTPKADPSKPVKYVILVRDLGALRLPPLLMSIGFAILFAISLALLHSLERAKEGTGKGELEPTPALA
jgi:hypothetical protein